MEFSIDEMLNASMETDYTAYHEDMAEVLRDLMSPHISLKYSFFILPRDVERANVPEDWVKLAFLGAVRQCQDKKQLNRHYDFPKYGIRLQGQPSSLQLRVQDGSCTRPAILYIVSFHVAAKQHALQRAFRE